MTVHLQCDYCGEPIDRDDKHVKIEIHGHRPTDRYRGVRDYEHVNEYFGHFHTDARLEDGESCEGKMLAAMWLAREWGPTLETINTLTGQAAAARRRQHTKPDGAE